MFQYLFLNMTYKLVLFSLEDTACSFYGVPVQNVIKKYFPTNFHWKYNLL